MASRMLKGNLAGKQVCPATRSPSSAHPPASHLVRRRTFLQVNAVASPGRQQKKRAPPSATAVMFGEIAAGSTQPVMPAEPAPVPVIPSPPSASELEPTVAAASGTKPAPIPTILPELKPESFQAFVSGNSPNAISAVMFVGEHCGPCQMMKPKFIKMKYIFPSFKFGTFNISASQPEHCGPCQMMKPEFIKMKNVFPSFQFATFNISASPEHAKTASALRVRTIPSFHVYRGGRQVDMMTGARVVRLRQMLLHFFRPF
eukprot:gene14222-20193_t